MGHDAHVSAECAESTAPSGLDSTVLSTALANWGNSTENQVRSYTIKRPLAARACPTASRGLLNQRHKIILRTLKFPT